MSGLDLFILSVICLSALYSYPRGFFREVMSLSPWLAAILVAMMFSNQITVLLPIDSVQSTQARAAISALTLFMLTLMLVSLINWLVQRIMAKSVISKLDRIAGVCFGVIRGMFIVSLLILAANLTPELRQESWWQNSTLIPPFQKVAKFIHARLPEGIGQHFDFTPNGY